MPEKLEKISEQGLEEKDYAQNRQFIIERFRELDIEIEKNEQLLERLVELKEDGHFDDAIKMARIIDVMSLPEAEKRKLKIAALVHDIGKTGKVDDKDEKRKLIRKIFTYKFKDSVNLTAREAINKELKDDAEKDEIINYLADQKIDIDNRNMKELWRDHVDDTYSILKKLRHEDIDEETINIAASHHYLEGRNPAELKEEEISKEIQIFGMTNGYLILTLVDKYQAYREREEPYSHQKAIQKLRDEIKDSKQPENIKKGYRKAVDLLEGMEEDLEKIIRENNG